MKKIRIAANFKPMPGPAFKVLAGRVFDMFYSSEYFPDPPVTREEFAAAYNRYSDTLLEAMDGAISKRAARDSAKEVLIGCLKRLIPYVLEKAQGDMTIILASGFQVITPKTKGPVSLLPPKIRKMLHGGSGIILFYVQAIAEAYSYQGRHAMLNDDGLPGDWTEFPIPKVKQAIKVSGLTRGKVYAFQVKALGELGYSDWSGSRTIRCV